MSSRLIRTARPHHASVEALESRIAPATWVVTTLDDVSGDDGLLSLREALTAANTNAAFHDAGAGSLDGDVITFDPSLSGTLELLSNLTITDDVTIDGSVDDGHITLDVNGHAILIDTSNGVGTKKTAAINHLDLTSSALLTAAPIQITSSVPQTTVVSLDHVDAYEFVGSTSGGVFFIDESTLTIRDSAFDSNQTGATGVGGVISASASTLTIQDSYFDDNSAPDGLGGALHVENNTQLTLIRVDFDDNSASAGGAIYIKNSTATYKGGRLTDNQADVGGAIYNLKSGGGSGVLTLNSVYFAENSATNEGGALFTDTQGLVADPGDVIITHGSFTENSAANDGGAIRSSSSMVITGVEFVGNEASISFGYGGAIVLLGNSRAHIIGSTFYDNSAGFRGGAIFTEIGGHAHRIEQSTFFDNYAGSAGGNAFIRGGSTSIFNSTFVGGQAAVAGNIAAADTQLTLTSTIVADSSEDLYAFSNTVIHAQNSLIETAVTGVVNGISTNNLFGVDPLLGTFETHGGRVRVYNLLPGSPAIDAGLNPNSYDNDQRGTPFKRTEGTGTDIGSFEAPPAPVVTLLSGGKVAQFRDVDGDLVSISTNRGAFTASNFYLISEGLGARLVNIDLAFASQFEGANISVKAARTAVGGDGFVNVGSFDAYGINLGSVLINGDVGNFYAGSSDQFALAVKSLNVLSFGEFSYYSDISIHGKIGTLTVRTDIINGGLTASEIGILKVTGSLLSTDIEVDRGISSVFVGGNMIDSELLAEGSIGLISASPVPGKFRYVGGITIKGSMVGSDIGTNRDLANLRITGDVQASQLSVRGDLNAIDLLEAQTVGNLTVGGRVIYSNFLIGYDLDLELTNSDTQVEKVAITGSWVASNLAVGVERGLDGLLGTIDDEVISDLNPSIVSRIGSIVIKGAAYGTPSLGSPELGSDYYGIVAEEIVKGKIGLANLPLTAGASNNLTPLLFGTTFDFAVREVSSLI